MKVRFLPGHKATDGSARAEQPDALRSLSKSSMRRWESILHIYHLASFKESEKLLFRS